jgi:tetratricopeptide (TPR) repeat protein
MRINVRTVWRTFCCCNRYHKRPTLLARPTEPDNCAGCIIRASVIRLTPVLILSAISGWCQPPSDYAAAASLVKSGQPAAAIAILQRVLAASPGNLQARNLLGIAFLNSGRKEDAGAQFKEALRIDPNFQPALKNLGVGEMALGQRLEARRDFERLLKLSPADPVAHLYMGEISFAERRYAEALSHYRHSGGLHLKDPPVVLHFARSAVESKQYAAAEQALEHLPSGVPALHFEAALLLAGIQRFDPAVRQFHLAEGYPDRYQAGFHLALVYLQARNYQAAIQTAKPLVRDNPKAELYNLLGRAYDGAGRSQDAYDALRTATQIDPQDETNYLDLMSLCLAHENWTLSLEIADVALNRIAGSWRVRLQRGAVLAMQGRLEDAAAEFTAAGRLAPDASLPLVASAVLQIERKEPEQAVDALRAYRAGHPKDYLVDWFLGEALVQSGSPQQAMEPLQEAVRLNPAAVPPRVLLGKLLAQRGDSESATRLFEEALKQNPNEVAAAYQLALLYRKAGNVKRAEELMAKVGKVTSVPEAAPISVRDLVRIVR